MQNGNINTSGRDINPSIAVDSQAVYVAYQTDGDVSGGGGNNGSGSSIVLLRFDMASGGVVWARQSIVSTPGGYDQNPKVAVDISGYISYILYIRNLLWEHECG